MDNTHALVARQFFGGRFTKDASQGEKLGPCGWKLTITLRGRSPKMAIFH